MGCAEGQSPFAGSLRVSLRHKLFPLPGQACPEPDEGKGARGPVLSPIEGMVERVFQHPLLVAEISVTFGRVSSGVQSRLVPSIGTCRDGWGYWGCPPPSRMGRTAIPPWSGVSGLILTVPLSRLRQSDERTGVQGLRKAGTAPPVLYLRRMHPEAVEQAGTRRQPPEAGPGLPAAPPLGVG